MISILELEGKLDDIRDAMRRDALPTDMEHVDPPQSELDALNEMTFVRQLRSVGVGNTRVQYAKRDYYRAFTQRSLWTRQNLLFDGEVARFEKKRLQKNGSLDLRLCVMVSAMQPMMRQLGRQVSNCIIG